MKEDAQGLDEVVVIGYGTVKKRDLTGAVASVNAAKISAVPTSTASEALQGRIPGLSFRTPAGRQALLERDDPW
ncbi:MAG: hypothetical protein ACLRS8_02510 [Parabacteroides merdae]